MKVVKNQGIKYLFLNYLIRTLNFYSKPDAKKPHNNRLVLAKENQFIPANYGQSNRLF
jgi:hypothetical protein